MGKIRDYWNLIKQAVAIENSTAVSDVSYDSNKKVLLVKFRNGRIYEYYGVPKSEYHAILNAPSAGRYMSLEIVGPNKYQYRELV